MSSSDQDEVFRTGDCSDLLRLTKSIKCWLIAGDAQLEPINSLNRLFVDLMQDRALANDLSLLCRLAWRRDAGEDRAIVQLLFPDLYYNVLLDVVFRALEIFEQHEDLYDNAIQEARFIDAQLGKLDGCELTEFLLSQNTLNGFKTIIEYVEANVKNVPGVLDGREILESLKASKNVAFIATQLVES